jgi:biotin carboxyl carrier protein
VRAVAQLLQESGLHEIVVESSEGAVGAPFRLKLRRESRGVAPHPAPPAATAPHGATPVQAAPVAGGAESGRAAESPATPTAIDVAATAVGIYRSPKQPLSVGDAVRRKQVIAIVESLKIPTEVLAPADGIVAEILVQPDAGVEYGQVLLSIDPATA